MKKERATKSRSVRKSKAVRSLSAKTLSPKQAKGIKGGRAGRGDKGKYLEIKLKEVLI